MPDGLLLAKHYTVDTEVVQWFAFIHDLERRDGDIVRCSHGQQRWRRSTMNSCADSDQLATLQACAEHSDGWVEAEATVMVCWDADRLDLGRVGIYPSARYLCTGVAR